MKGRVHCLRPALHSLLHFLFFSFSFFSFFLFFVLIVLKRYLSHSFTFVLIQPVKWVLVSCLIINFPEHHFWPTSSIALIDAFLVLQISGAVAFAFIVFSACLFRDAKRHLIWFSFCISWMFFGVSYSFLLFAGQQYKTKPARIPCTIQAGLIYAAPYLWAMIATNGILQPLTHLSLRFRVMGTSLGLIVHVSLSPLLILRFSERGTF